MNEPFDPYYVWLGIPLRDRPLDLYRLLGIRPFESDPIVIESAADQRMAHIRAFQTGPRSELVGRILNELAAARVVLLNPQKKAAYDEQLKRPQPTAASPQMPLDAARRGHRLPVLAVIAGIVAATALIGLVVVLFATKRNLAAEKDNLAQSEAKDKPAQAGAALNGPQPATLPATSSPDAASGLSGRASLAGEKSVDSTDILSLVDLKKDVLTGQVQRAGGALTIAIEPVELRFPYQLPPQYELDMTVKRLSGTGVLSLYLTIAGRRFRFDIDYAPRGKAFTGISDVDRKSTSDNRHSHRGTVLPENVSRQVSLTVRTNSVRLVVEGGTVYEWQGNVRRIGIYRAESFDFGITTHHTALEIQSLTLKPILDTAGETSVATSTEPTPQAVDPEQQSTSEPAAIEPARYPKPKSAPPEEPESDSPSEEHRQRKPQAPLYATDLPASANVAATDVRGKGQTYPAAMPRPSRLDSTNAPLATAALKVFQQDCYRCHGHQGSNEGGLNFILQSDKLVAKRYIVPGDPAASRIYKRIAEGSMPPEQEQPRPSADQIASIKTWIDAGAPQLIAPPANRVWITNAKIVKAIRDDVQRRDSADRRFARYFTLTHLYNAGLSDDELQTYRLGLSKLVNSLSWGDQIVVPQAIDAAKTILRIDLRDFKWTEKTWDEILQQNPYSVLNDVSRSPDLTRLTKTELPFVRADWFVAAGSVPPLYHQVLDIPETSAELENLLRISVPDDIQQLRAARAGFNKSGISQNNRMIERHATYFGAYWRSYDFAHSDGRANIFSHPLGPDTGANSFRHDAGEIIFNLPNGLQAYMVVDGAGERLDKAVTTIVSDPRRPDRAVVNGLSCISCHIGGIHEKADEVRAAVHANRKSFTTDEVEAVDAMYLPQAKMRELQTKDAERFQRALKLTGTLPSRTEPVLLLVQRFEQPLDLPLASAELGFEPAKLMELFDNAPQSSRTLAALRIPGGTVQRQVFLDSLDTLAGELGLEHGHTAAVGTVSATPPEENISRVAADAPHTEPASRGPSRRKSGAAGNDLTPLATLKLVAEIPDIILSKDRRWVFFLNASEGTVERIDTQTQALDDKTVKAVAGAERLRLAPNGRTLYVSGSPQGHNTQTESPGNFQVIGAESFESIRSFTVPFDPWDFAPDDKGRLFVTSGSAQSVPVRLVDTNKQAVVADLFLNWERTAIRLSRDGRTLAADNSHEINVFPLLIQRGKPSQQRLEPLASLEASGPFELSGDDRFLITLAGPVGRLGGAKNRNLPVAASLDRSLAIAIDPRSKFVFATTEDRQLRIYSTPDFEVVHSFNIGARISAMAVDTAAGLLYAAVNEEIKNRRPTREATVSNIKIFDINGILGNDGGAQAPGANGAAPQIGAESGNSKSSRPVATVEGAPSKAGLADNNLRPQLTFKLRATIPDLLLPRDRKFVYFLNASDGEIRRLDTDTLKLDDTIVTTGDGAERIRLTPNGKILYAITAPDGHPREGESSTGKIIVVATQRFEATSRFTIQVDPLDLAADNSGRIFVLAPGQRTHLQLINAHKQAAISQPAVIWSGLTLSLSPDERNLAVGEDQGATILPTAELSKIRGTALIGPPGTREFRDGNSRRGRGRTAFSPDGRFLVVDSGRVGRVGNSRDKQLPEVAQIGAWDAIAFDPSGPRVFISTEDKQLKVFSLPDFELQRALNIGTRITEMAIDPIGGKLFAAVAEKVDRNPRAVTADDLAVFDISDLLVKAGAK